MAQGRAFKFPLDSACVLDNANVAALLWTENVCFSKTPGLLWANLARCLTFLLSTELKWI